MKLSTLLLFSAFSLSLALPVLAQVPDPVARVNNQPITQQAFVKALSDWYGKEVLEEAIAVEIINQAAKAANITVTDAQVDESIARQQMVMDMQAERTGRSPGFAEWLETSRLTLNHLRSFVRTEMLLTELVKPQVKVTDDMTSNYYNTNIAKFKDPLKIKLSIMALKTLEDATAVRAAILKGEMTWDVAVQTKNVDPIVMQNGSEIGFVPNDPRVPFFAAGYLLKQDGEITEPVDFNEAFWLARRDEKVNERIKPFEEVKELIKEQLSNEQIDRLKEETRTSLTKQAHIERLFEITEAPLAIPAPPAGG